MKVQGFTLIELVVVIVILGILSVVVAPKFIDLEGDAHQSVVDGIAGAAASAASMNYASCAANSHEQSKCNGGGCITVATCASIEDLVLDVDWNAGSEATSGFDITAVDGNAQPSANGSRADCTVNDKTNNKTATFPGIGACIAPN
jgi:MSHA pilin protein MshA